MINGRCQACGELGAVMECHHCQNVYCTECVEVHGEFCEGEER